MLEAADWGARADFPNSGTLLNMGARPSFVSIGMSASASAAITCSREVQFRMLAIYASNKFPFTNNDDSYVR